MFLTGCMTAGIKEDHVLLSEIETAIKIQRYIDTYNKPWTMTLVHDSLIVELPVEDVSEYIKISGRRNMCHHLMVPKSKSVRST